MAFYLDSANYAHAQNASNWGWLKGITTNPKILAQAQEGPEKALANLASLNVSQIFYQLCQDDPETMMHELLLAKRILGKKLVVKLPPTDYGFNFLARLSYDTPTCVTAVYSLGQAYIAKELGASMVAVYVNRLESQRGHSLAFLSDLKDSLAGSGTEILAASLKSPQQALNALQAGAHSITTSFEVLAELNQDSLSSAAIEDFKRTGTGIALTGRSA